MTLWRDEALREAGTAMATTGDPYADALLDELDATAEAREFEREWWERHDEEAAAAAHD